MAQVDFIIRIGESRHTGDLVIDGRQMRRVILQDLEDVELQVRRLQMAHGTDVCIHLKILSRGQMDGALILAQRLDRLGATIGLSGSGGIALTATSGYNVESAADNRRAPTTTPGKRELCEFS